MTAKYLNSNHWEYHELDPNNGRADSLWPQNYYTFIITFMNISIMRIVFNFRIYEISNLTSNEDIIISFEQLFKKIIWRFKELWKRIYEKVAENWKIDSIK